MKKFLIFLVSIIVVVCLGLTTYYFLRNDEVITIATKELYVNAGDIISLDSLGINVKKPYKKTTYNYNAGGEQVTKHISFDESKGYYVVNQTSGGEVNLVISTSNKKFKQFNIIVHIGNGTKENPYFIFNENGLAKIGSTYRLDNSYILMNDITLTNSFAPIGYSAVTGQNIGFSGNFNGNGKTISGLNVTTGNVAGLFTEIKNGATVENLIINNATIAGSFENAGILAGVVNGNVNKVGVENSTISNSMANSNIGALVGKYNGLTLTQAYANNVTINVDAENCNVGGLVGVLDKTTAVATYANDVIINSAASAGVVGGYVGEFIIDTNAGSIQQSYANANSTFANYAAFVGKVTKATSFDSSKANMLTHFVGNIAIVSSKATDESIVNADLIKSYDNAYFTKLFDEASSLYSLRGFSSAGRVIETNEYVYYAIDSLSKTLWDTTYIWKLNTAKLPTLIMGQTKLVGVSGEYFRKDLELKEVRSTETFKSIFASDVNDAKVKLTTAEIDLTSGWTPVKLTNTTLDANNATIKINLNNPVGNNLGLFTTLDNSTIKNLNIVVTGVGANATNAGALAGVITSSASTISSIENVTVTFENSFNAVAITNFGGIAGVANNANINNVTISGLNVNQSADLANVGAIVGDNSATISNANVTATIYGYLNVGGVAGINNATISNATANAVVNYNKANADAKVGGLVGYNANGVVVDSSANISVVVTNANTKLYVGGVAGSNAGTIANVTVSGEGIAIGSKQVKVNGTIYAGGVAGSNEGNIENVTNNATAVGTLFIGADYHVAGVAGVNSGKISKVLTSSNIYGNYVAGVVVEMKTAGEIDQVVVGSYNKGTKAVSEKVINGDKYVAGIVVDMRAGKITNVQAVSKLIGEASTTKTSLIALIFPSGATIKNCTINSIMTGYGSFYRETWTDFASYNNKSDFGFEENSGLGASAFNIYRNTTNAGTMQSIVINSKFDDEVSVKSAMAGENNFLGFIPTSNDYNGVNFVKVVDDFADYSEFEGSFTFNCAYNTVYKTYVTATKTLSFEVGTIWENVGGINLLFLNNL